MTSASSSTGASASSSTGGTHREPLAWLTQKEAKAHAALVASSTSPLNSLGPSCRRTHINDAFSNNLNIIWYRSMFPICYIYSLLHII